MTLSRIRVSSPTLSPRISTFQCVVPFQKGAVGDLATLNVDGSMGCDFEPFGQRWDDGSHRHARVTATVQLLAGETKSFLVEVGPRTAPSRDPWKSASLLGLILPYSIGSGSDPLSLPAGDGGLGVSVTHMWGRCWAKWHLRYDAHQTVVHWRLTTGFSEPQSTALSLQLTDPIEIVLPQSAGFLVVTNGEQKGVVQRYANGNWTTTFLPVGTKIAHGQAHGWRGVYIADPALFEAEKVPLLAVAENWNEVGIGPAETKLTYPPWLPSYNHVRAACERKILQRNGFPKRDPYFDPVFGLGKTSAETGAQDDFGVIHGNAGFLGSPEWLDLAISDAIQEWCRPCHFREVDGSPVRTANHPRLNRWMGRPHYNPGVSPDQLGKPAESTWSQAQRDEFAAATHGWSGIDPQHTSRLLLHTTALMTGDPQLLDLVDDAAEEYLSSYTLPSDHPGYFSSSIDAARAVGRTSQDASWIIHLLDRQDIKDRLTGRVHQVVLPEFQKSAGRQVRPIDIVTRVNLTAHSPWPTYLDQSGHPVASPQPREWHPWQEGIAAFGLWCAWKVLGSIEAMGLAIAIADNMVRNGWQDRSPFWQVAKAVEYTGNLVQNNSVMQDTGFEVLPIESPVSFISADNTDYRYWVAGGLIVSVLGSMDANVQQKAVTILASLPRQATSDGFMGTWDRFVPQ